jgi:hypothetical protein
MFLAIASFLLAAVDYGILDVTQKPYGADPSGKTDSTRAIQRAVDDARDQRLVVFFPAGDYRVSDSIIANQQNQARRDHPLLNRRDDFPCVLWGSAGRKRARILLADNAPGFGDPANPRPVIYFISFLKENEVDNPNISFNQMVISLDVDVGRGNAGAIGVDQQGAQGSVAEDVHVNASGAFAGFRGVCGSGGSFSHVSVRGGRYGLYLAGVGLQKAFSGSQPSPVISYLTLTGQTEKSILSAARGPLTLAGALIEGPGILVEGARNPFDGALNVVDSVIRYRGTGPVISANRPVYLSNVYVHGASRIAQVQNAPPLEGAGEGWIHIAEYAASPSATYPVWLDGSKRDKPVVDVRHAAAPPDGFRRAHEWTEKLPSWEDTGVANVKKPPYSARGDSFTDDTSAIQKALDSSRDVFLPKGIYRISQPLRLRASSRLFGIGVHSKIEALTDAAAFSDPANPSPLLAAPDDAGATCVAAFFQLWVRTPGAYALHWRAGRNSIVRNVRTKLSPWEKGAAPANHPAVLIDRNGGGRWYNALMHEKLPQTLNHRHILARGTREPLVFYMLNPEHSNADYMVEFDDVRRLRVYGLKSETIGANGPRELTPLLLRNSSDFRFYGHGGNASAPAGHPLYLIEACSDFTLANFSYQFFPSAAEPSRWYLVEERTSSQQVVRAPASEFFTLYKRK